MIVLKNLAESFITSAISETATEITIPADHADLFPSLLEGDNFRAALVNPATSATEFINVTARNGNVLTVVRGEEGVAALPFPVESRIHLRMTAETWEEMAGECWMRPKDRTGKVAIPQFIDSSHFSLAGDYRDFFKTNRAIKAYPNLSVGFVESVVFAENITTVKVIEMTVPDTLSHIEAGLDPDALAKRTLSNEELLGYMTPVPVIAMEALEVDGGTLVHGTISHPEKGKVYPDSTEFHFSLPDNVTDFELSGLNFKLRVPVITEENSPQSVGPITCRAAQMSLILSNSSNPITLSVRYVAIKAGVTLAFADTQDGYPDADVNDDGAKLPACTTGLNNPSGKSIVSSRPEFEIAGSELNIIEVSDKFIKVVQEIKEGDELIFDNGQGAAGTVISENSDSVPTDSLLALYDMKNVTDTVIPDVSGNGRDMIITKNEDKAVGTATVNGVPRNFVQNTNASAPTNQQGFCAKYALPTGITISEGLSWSYWLRTDRTYANVSSLPDAGTGYPCVDRFGGIIFNSYSVWLAIDAVKNAARDSIDLYSWTTSGGGKVLFKPVQGEWFHLTVTVKGTLANVYLNGEFLTSHTVPDLSIRTESLGVNLQLFSTFPGGDIFRAIASCAFFAAYNKELSPDEVSRIYKGTKYNIDISSFGLSAAPAKAFKKPTIGATIGTGATDEPINPETALTLGDGSTNSKLILTSDTSIKNKIYTDGSIHKNIKCDGQDVAVESVSESVVDSIFITTVNLATPLAKVPTTVALPSCFTIPSAIESCIVSGSALKFTGAKVDISDPAVKRLALKVVGDDSLRVKAAKIYTEEGA